jgi:DNA excision repair protein ERCC-2
VRWADVVVGDVHHLFDGKRPAVGPDAGAGLEAGVLVDEAHNLVERARQMYSAELRISQVRAAAQTAPGPREARWMRPGAGDRGHLVVDAAAPYHVLDACPTPSCRPCRPLAARWPSTSTSTRWRSGRC